MAKKDVIGYYYNESALGWKIEENSSRRAGPKRMSFTGFQR
jgi:hypothetical protein